MENVERFLRTLPLFNTFSSIELKILIEKSQLKTFEPQRVIIRFGQPGTFLGVILHGEAEAVVTGETGKRQQLGLVKQGDILGEMSLLTGEPTSADVIALKKCKVLLIPQETFSTSLAVNPEAVKVLARIMTQRLRSRQQSEEAQARIEEAWQRAPDPYGLRLSTARPMKILVINCGSSSLKYGYFDTEKETNNLEGQVERIGLEGSRITLSSQKRKISKELGSIDHSEAFEAVVALITSLDEGIIQDLNELTAVGHRVVHGGDKYGSAAIIDDAVIEDIDKNSFAAFDLFGKIANINSEGSENLFKYTEKFKKFTGNSPIHAIIKHRDPITFYNQAKIIIMSEFFKKFILKFNGSKGEPKN